MNVRLLERKRNWSAVAVVFFGSLACSGCIPLFAQISMATAVALAMKHSPRIKLAQDDVNRANAVHREVKDAYVPSIAANGGAGGSYGITLNVPTIFSMNAQSLVYSSQQRSSMRASALDAKAAELALADAREALDEDVATTYITLAGWREMAAVLGEETGLAAKLGEITTQRQAAGLADESVVDQAKKTSIQIELQAMQMEDQIASLRQHLTELTGLPTEEVIATSDSIPVLPTNLVGEGDGASVPEDGPAVAAAETTARATQERASGEMRFAWRPQVNFEAQYGRVSPINSVSDYYNLHGNYNAANAGVVIQFPILDAVRKQRARETEIDAVHASHQTMLLKSEQSEDRSRLVHTLRELKAKEQLAALEQKMTAAQLEATRIQVKSGGFDGPPMTPEDETNSQLQERQRYFDLLDARLQLKKSEVFQLRKLGKLQAWLESNGPASAQ